MSLYNRYESILLDVNTALRRSGGSNREVIHGFE